MNIILLQNYDGFLILGVILDIILDVKLEFHWHW